MSEDEGRPVISDARAQTLASYWADPRDPTAPLSQLARDGSISEAMVDELRHDLRILETSSEQSVAQGQLRALLAYALSCGERGPVRGWETLQDQARYRDDTSLDVVQAPVEPEPEPVPETYEEDEGEEEMSALDLPFPGDWDER